MRQMRRGRRAAAVRRVQQQRAPDLPIAAADHGSEGPFPLPLMLGQCVRRCVAAAVAHATRNPVSLTLSLQPARSERTTPSAAAPTASARAAGISPAARRAARPTTWPASPASSSPDRATFASPPARKTGASSTLKASSSDSIHRGESLTGALFLWPRRPALLRAAGRRGRGRRGV